MTHQKKKTLSAHDSKKPQHDIGKWCFGMFCPKCGKNNHGMYLRNTFRVAKQIVNVGAREVLARKILNLTSAMCDESEYFKIVVGHVMIFSLSSGQITFFLGVRFIRTPFLDCNISTVSKSSIGTILFGSTVRSNLWQCGKQLQQWLVN